MEKTPFTQLVLIYNAASGLIITCAVTEHSTAVQMQKLYFRYFTEGEIFNE